MGKRASDTFPTTEQPPGKKRNKIKIFIKPQLWSGCEHKAEHTLIPRFPFHSPPSPHYVREFSFKNEREASFIIYPINLRSLLLTGGRNEY
jgi:hypothetical protein